MSIRSKILCLFSGGLDSAGALWKLIHDTTYADYDILVHHVHLVNSTNRFTAEKQAIEQTIPLFNKYTQRKLYYSSTIIDFAFLGKSVPIDADLYGFVAANLVNIDLSIKFIALGRTLDDKNSGNDPLTQLVDRINNALYLCNYTRPTFTTAECLTPVVTMTKQQIWAMLPPEIRTSTWSCRTPIYQADVTGSLIATPCQNCHACQFRAKLK